MFMFFVIAFLAYLLGLFGFSQIIGSLQNVKTRGAGMTVFTIAIWFVILMTGWFLRNRFAPEQDVAYYVATAVSFVQILLAGKIQ